MMAIAVSNKQGMRAGLLKKAKPARAIETVAAQKKAGEIREI
jgi:hypothetical protein